MAESTENAPVESKPRRPRPETDATESTPTAPAKTDRPRAYTLGQYAQHSHRLLGERAWLVKLAIRKAHLRGDFIELDAVRKAVTDLKKQGAKGRTA